MAKVAENPKSKNKIRKSKEPAKKIEVSAPDINSAEFRDEFFGFMRGKTIGEMREKFGLTDEQIETLLKNPPEKHGIYKDSSRHTATYFCIFKGGRLPTRERIWTYVLAQNEGAAVDIIFPEDIGWRKERLSDPSNRKLEKMRIVPIADIWFGDPLHDENLFAEKISWIAREPHVFWFFNGDAIKPPPVGEIKEGVLESLYTDFRKKLAPIAHKWLWAQEGCFEAKLHQIKDAFDPIEDLCSEWNIPYFRTPVSVGIHWSGNLFKFYCIHGKSQAQKKGSKINAIARILGEVEFHHYYVMSHIKDSISNKQVRVSQDVGKFDLVERKQYVFITPSFVRYDGSREAKWGYPLPGRGQVNCALYKDGDYHFYSSPIATGLVDVAEEKAL
ncbi:MAG: hypothetical protein HYW09_01065 [Candidatus Niyogibacteria bacterium]|nr:hypothetical protein [Candidatus Niyogibacteria bacterium]